MRRQLGATLVAAGLMLVFLFFIQAAMQGNASYGGVILIGPIPIVFGSSPLMALASMFLAIGLALIFLGTMLLILPEKRTKGDEKASMIKGGAVVMIGPIPLVVGSDSRIALLMMLVALAIMILWTQAAKGG